MKCLTRRCLLCLIVIVLFLPFSATGEPITFVKHVVTTSHTNAASVCVEDMDGDGDSDFIATGWENSWVGWYENQGTSDYRQHWIDFQYNGRHISVADIDNDNDIDVLGASATDNNLTWWENQGSNAYVGVSLSTSLNGAHTTDIADLDDDGDKDFLVATWNAGYSWWENDGTEQFVTHQIYGTVVGGTDIHADDLDGDGDKDIIAVGYESDAIYFFENDGEEDFTTHVIVENVNGVHWSTIADFDGDGDRDIAAACYLASEVLWFENDGEENFTEHLISSFNGASWIGSADLDNDGDIDILASAENIDEIAYWENDGAEDPSFEKHTIDTDFNRVMGEYICDIDGDGDLDFAGAAVQANEVSWWESLAMDPNAISGYAEPAYLAPSNGDFQLLATISNPADFACTVTGTIMSGETTVLTDLPFHDDGQHGDGEAGDNLYGAAWSAPGEARFYSVDITVTKQATSTSITSENILSMTTVGPVSITSIEVTEGDPPTPGARYGFRPTVSNGSTAETVPDIRIYFEEPEQGVTFLQGLMLIVGDIEAGSTSAPPSRSLVQFSEDLQPEDVVTIPCTFTSDGYTYWEGEVAITMASSSTWETSTATPNRFLLNSIHPNPFNASTTLSFQVPTSGSIELTVSNMLGQTVFESIEQVTSAGNVQLELNGSTLASGNYLVQAHFGNEPVQCRKITLVK